MIGAVLWESARNAFGWLIGTDNFYLRLFGPLGGVVALLGWIYLSSAILVFTGSSPGRSRWSVAGAACWRGVLPRQAGLEGWVEPFERDNAVNEAHE